MTAERPQPTTENRPADTTNDRDVWTALAWLNRVAPAPRPDDREPKDVRVSGYF